MGELYAGVDDCKTPVADGPGHVFIDDVRLTKP
jgi:hypothetical protein